MPPSGSADVGRSDAVLAVDLGTGSVRACLVSLDGRVLAKGSRRIRAHAPPEAPSGREYDAAELHSCVAEAVRDAMTAAPGTHIGAITADGMRPALVALDAQGNPLHIGANLDLRAIEQSVGFLSAHRELFHRTTGQLPPTLQWPSRIAWFLSHLPEILEKTVTFTGLEGWVLSLFGVEPVMDLSCASGTGLFDLRSRQWSQEILGLIDLEDARLAPVVPTGTALGPAMGDTARALSLEGIPVCAGGGDTHGALAGAGGWVPGARGAGASSARRTIVVAGTTMAAVRVLDDPGPRSERLWSSLFLHEGTGMVEAQCWEAGLAWEWLAEAMGIDVASLDGLATDADPGIVTAHLGTAPVDFSNPPLLRNGGLVLPLPPSMFGVGRAALARAALESAAWAAVEAIGWLDADAASTGPSDSTGTGLVSVTGGMTRSPLWLSLLAGALGRPVRVAQEDSATVGLASFAAAGSGLLGDPRTLLDASRTFDREVPLDEGTAAVMQAGQSRWRETVARLEEGAVRLSSLLTSP